MGKSIDLVEKSAREGYELAKKNAKRIFMDLLKVEFLAYGIYAAAVILAVVIASIFFWDWIVAVFELQQGTELTPPSFSGMNIAGMLIIIGIFIVSGLLGSVATTVTYNVVDNVSAGKKTSILKHFKENMFPIIKLSIITWAVTVVLFLPFLLPLLLGALAACLSCIFGLLSIVLLVLFFLFIQFSAIEIVVRKKGVIDSIKYSVSLVRKNFFAVILLDILLFLIGLLASVGDYVVRVVLQIIPATLSLIGLWGMVIGYAIAIVLGILFYAVLSAAVSTLATPIFYKFWRKISG